MITGGVDVAADQVGHHRGVDDTQSLDPAHPQFGVDDRHRVAGPAHLAGAERMMRGRRCRANIGIERLRRSRTSAPGASSRAAKSLTGGVAQRRRTSFNPSRIVRRSFSVARKFCRILTGTRGSAEASCDLAAAFRMQHHRAQREPVGIGAFERRQIGPSLGRHRAKQELDVGQFELGPGFDKPSPAARRLARGAGAKAIGAREREERCGRAASSRQTGRAHGAHNRRAPRDGPAGFGRPRQAALRPGCRVAPAVPGRQCRTASTVAAS